jgi:hypothetical protein
MTLWMMIPFESVLEVEEGNVRAEYVEEDLGEGVAGDTFRDDVVEKDSGE